MIRKVPQQSLSRAEQLRQKRQPVSNTSGKSEAPVPPVHTPVLPVMIPSAQKPVQKHGFPFRKNAAKSNPLHTSGTAASRNVSRAMPQASVVTTRSYPYSTPLHQSMNSTPRRKVYKMNANGVETRMPALPVVHFSWQWVSGFMVVALTVVVLLMTILPVFNVNTIEIQGLQRVPAADVEAIIRNNGGSIFTFDPQTSINAIGIAYPELTDINMRVKMNGAITLSVSERVPVLSWTSQGQTIWVDSEGVVMSPRGDPGAIAMVLSDDPAPITTTASKPGTIVEYVQLALSRKTNPLKAEDTISRMDPRILQASLDFFAQMPGGSNLIYDSISGMGWQDSTGLKVYFGQSLDNIEFQQIEYKAIMDNLSQMGITPTVISVEHIDAPFYRTK